MRSLKKELLETKDTNLTGPNFEGGCRPTKIAHSECCGDKAPGDARNHIARSRRVKCSCRVGGSLFDFSVRLKSECLRASRHSPSEDGSTFGGLI